MKRIAFLLTLTACLPDTDQLINDAKEQCRATIQEEIPQIVAQVTTAAITVCNNLTSSLVEAPDAISSAVLLQLGCVEVPSNGTWDCTGSTICLLPTSTRDE